MEVDIEGERTAKTLDQGNGSKAQGKKYLAKPNYKNHFKVIDRTGWTAERNIFLLQVKQHFLNREEQLLIIDIPSGDGWENCVLSLGMIYLTSIFPGKIN